MRDGNDFFIYKLRSRWTQPPQSAGKVGRLYLVAPAIRHASPILVYDTPGRRWTPWTWIKDGRPPSARGTSSEVFFIYWHGHVQQVRAKLIAGMLSHSTGAGTQ